MKQEERAGQMGGEQELLTVLDRYHVVAAV